MQCANNDDYNDDYVVVDGLDVHIGDVSIPLPEEVVSWVADFDDGYTVEVPFAFQLDVPADLSLEYVRGRMVVLSSSAGECGGQMRTMKEMMKPVCAAVRRHPSVISFGHLVLGALCSCRCFPYSFFNGLRWMARAGASWRITPNDLPPWYTVYE